MSHSIRAVPGGRFGPRETALSARCSTYALCCGCDGRGLELGHDEIAGVRCDEGSGCHPAGEVGFEGEHVGCAGEFRFTGDFVGDVVGEEGIEGAVEQTIGSVFPDG